MKTRLLLNVAVVLWLASPPLALLAFGLRLT